MIPGARSRAGPVSGDGGTSGPGRPSRARCRSISSRRARKRSTRRGSISARSTAADTAQSGSAPWAQSPKRQPPARSSMSLNTRLSASSASVRPRARTPGVSITIPAPSGSSTSRRATVVCRPRRSEARTWAVTATSAPARALTRLDLPDPLAPTRASVRPGPSRDRSSSMPWPLRTLDVSTATPPTTALTVSAAAAASAARSDFVSRTTIEAPLSRAITSIRSNRPGGRGRSRPATIPAMSKLAASTCSVSRSAGSRRASTVRRGSTLLIRGMPSPAASSTQSPVTGAISPCALAESDATRTMSAAVTTSHSPRSTCTTRPTCAPGSTAAATWSS